MTSHVRLRGTTLVELMIAVLVGLIVSGLAFSVFWWDQRRFAVDQARLTGVQGAVLFDETLSADLRRVALFLNATDATAVGGRFAMDSPQPVEVTHTGDGDTLQFMACSAATANRGRFATHLVRYEFDRRTSQVVRTEGSNRTPFRNLVVREMSFYFIQLQRTVPAVARSTYAASAALPFVKYQITCVSETFRDRPVDRQRQEENIVIVGLTPVYYSIERAYHPSWMMTNLELPEVPTP